MIKSVFPSANAGIFGRLLLSPPDFWEALITFPGSGYFGNVEVIWLQQAKYITASEPSKKAIWQTEGKLNLALLLDQLRLA